MSISKRRKHEAEVEAAFRELVDAIKGTITLVPSDDLQQIIDRRVAKWGR